MSHPLFSTHIFRIAALPLAFLLLFSLFVGCAGPSREVTTQAEPGATDTFAASTDVSDTTSTVDDSTLWQELKQPPKPSDDDAHPLSPPDTTVTPAEASTFDTLRTTDAPAPFGAEADTGEVMPVLTPPVELRTAMFDSLAGDSLAPSDTVAADSIAADTAETEEDDLDTTITYQSESIKFDVRTRTTTLIGNAVLRYKQMELQAHRIDVNWETNLMTATGTTDTVWADSAQTEVDSVIVIGEPVFKESGQVMYGKSMRVNMETKEGYVVAGRSEQDVGFYTGEDIQKVSDEVFYVRHGSFTTCDLEEKPHYKFTGDQMKMIYGDKIVGKPVVLRFGEVPVAAIPFGVFSIKKGRRSGLIVPTYGDNSRQGRHLKNLGYYWAASEYWDTKALLDFYEEQGFMVRNDTNYKIRYKLNGAVSGSYANRRPAGGSTQSWDMRVVHNQDLSPSARIRADATFASSNDHYSNYSDNLNRQVDQRIQSNVTFSKNWPGTRYSLSGNLRHTQNLQTGNNNQTLPSLNFRVGSGPLFPSRQQKKERDKGLIYERPIPASEREDEEEDEEKWYNKINWNYSANLENRRDETKQFKTVTVENEAGLDSTYQDSSFKVEWEGGMRHNAALTYSHTVFRYINFSPRISYDEDWVLERNEWFVNDSTGQIDSRQDFGFFQRRTFNIGANMQTKLYGYFNLRRWSIETIRHVLTPSVGLTWRPDYSDPEWDYYQRVPVERTVENDPDSVFIEEVLKDRYRGTIAGGTPSGKQLSMNLRLDNLFQMKRIKIDEEGETIEEKTDLFNFNVSTSYNFAADSLRFQDLRSSLRANPIKGDNSIGPLKRLSVDLSASHSFYQFDHEIGREVDKFYWDREEVSGLNVLRMTNFSTTSSFGFSGSSPFAWRKPKDGLSDRGADADTSLFGDDDIPDAGNALGDRFGYDSGFMNQGAPGAGGAGGDDWRINASLRYNLGMNNPMRPNETLKLGVSASVNLTRNWALSYSTSYDLMEKQVVASSLSINRDLHCWTGSLRWQPRGIGQGFYLHIGIKASILSDVKIDRRRGAGSFGGNFL
ncbi:hypothetical protein GF324_09030 [bacterium]|nr:hypothetical protein [bacterium]